MTEKRNLWQAHLDERGQLVTSPIFENWHGHTPTLDQAPFDALIWFLATDRKPPRELVGFLLGAWTDYLAGRVEFETAMLGPRKRRAGGYADQVRALRRRAALSGEFIRLLKTGKTRKAAAAEMVKRHRLQSAESFLKKFAGIGRKKSGR